jgi:RHS repeat-associated protein
VTPHYFTTSEFTLPSAGRKFAFRYTFNGKETDPESDLQDYGMRIYNAALGKFLSVDPITSAYPALTPYQFAGNTPIWAIDMDGLEQWYTNDGNKAEVSGPISDETRQGFAAPFSGVSSENPLINGSDKASDHGKYASILIKKGNVFTFNAYKQQQKDAGADASLIEYLFHAEASWWNQFKNEGNRAGGHAMILTSEGAFGFGGDTKLFGNDVGTFSDAHHNAGRGGYEWAQLMVEFPLKDITIAQYWGIVNTYQYSDGTAKTPPYGYNVLGYRCASSCLQVLNDNGVVSEGRTKYGNFIHGNNPNALVRYLQRKGFKSSSYYGGDGPNPQRKYNKRFKNAPK